MGNSGRAQQTQHGRSEPSPWRAHAPGNVVYMVYIPNKPSHCCCFYCGNFVQDSANDRVRLHKVAPTTSGPDARRRTPERSQKACPGLSCVHSIAGPRPGHAPGRQKKRRRSTRTYRRGRGLSTYGKRAHNERMSSLFRLCEKQHPSTSPRTSQSQVEILQDKCTRQASSAVGMWTPMSVPPPAAEKTQTAVVALLPALSKNETLFSRRHIPWETGSPRLTKSAAAPETSVRDSASLPLCPLHSHSLCLSCAEAEGCTARAPCVFITPPPFVVRHH